MPHLNTPAVRRSALALMLTPVALVALAAPALADAPTTWVDPEPVSTLYVLLILVGLPAALFLGITLLVYVPSMARGEKYTPGLAWRNESEWFGGPRGGIEAVDRAGPEAIEGAGERGGASARW